MSLVSLLKTVLGSLKQSIEYISLQIIGEKDADGFYWGECNGVGGFVPCNMVSEVQVDDDRVLQDMVTSNKVS